MKNSKKIILLPTFAVALWSPVQASEMEVAARITDNPFLTFDDIKAHLKSERDALIEAGKEIAKKELNNGKSQDSTSIFDQATTTSSKNMPSSPVKVLVVTEKKALIQTKYGTSEVRNRSDFHMGGHVFYTTIKNGNVKLTDKETSKVFFAGGAISSTPSTKR